MSLNILSRIFLYLIIGEIISQVNCIKNVTADQARNGEFPFQVSIHWTDPNDRIIHVCGGSIVDEYHVLTASHCVYRKNMEDHFIIAGTRDITMVTDPNRIFMKIEKAYLHPKFDHLFFINDIALLRVSPSFPRNHPFVRPIPLTDRSPMEEQQCIATGWGKSITQPNFVEENHNGILHKEKLRRFNQDKCELLYLTQYRGFIKPGMICMGHFGNSIFCPSDGGGPLVCNGKLSGLYSYSDVHLPDVFASVAYFRNWISKTKDRSYNELRKTEKLSLEDASLTTEENNGKSAENRKYEL